MISARPRLLKGYKISKQPKQIHDVLKHCNGKNNVAYITYLVSQDYQANVHYTSVCEILNEAYENNLISLNSENM